MTGPAGSRWGRVLVVLVFATALIAFFALGGNRWLDLQALKDNRDLLLAFTDRHYGWMLIAAFLAYAASTALSVPGGLVLSLAAGLLFGRWVGTLLIVAAATTGAVLVFLAARFLFADAARRRMGGLAERINRGFTEDAFNYMLFLRLVPLFPFWLVNLAPAFTGIRVGTYTLATAIGIVPGSFVFANLGQSLGSLNSLRDLLSPTIAGAFTLLGLFALIPVLVRRMRGRSDTPL